MSDLVLQPGETIDNVNLYFRDDTRFAPSLDVHFKYGKDYKVCLNRVVFLRSKKLALYLSNHALMNDLLRTGDLNLRHVCPTGVPHLSYWDDILEAIRSIYRNYILPKLTSPTEIIVAIDDHLSCVLSICSIK